MKAVVFSGTTEGRVFSRQLAALGAEVLVSVATPLGAEEQGAAVKNGLEMLHLQALASWEFWNED